MEHQLPEKFKSGIKERCGDKVTADGLECPYCGALETYKDATDPENAEKWFFVIRAFRVDNSSECTNCGQWFDAEADFTINIQTNEEHTMTTMLEQVSHYIKCQIAADSVSRETSDDGSNVFRFALYDKEPGRSARRDYWLVLRTTARIADGYHIRTSILLKSVISQYTMYSDTIHGTISEEQKALVELVQWLEELMEQRKRLEQQAASKSMTDAVNTFREYVKVD